MVHNMQHRSADEAPSIELQPHEITDAQLAIIKDAQKEGFKEDYKAPMVKPVRFPANSKSLLSPDLIPSTAVL